MSSLQYILYHRCLACCSHFGDCCPSAYSSRVLYSSLRIILYYYRPKDSNRPSDWYARHLWLYRQALLVYKPLNNGAPGYMKDMFNYVDQISTQPLRYSTENKLYLQKVHTKSIKYSGPWTWNALNKEIRNAKSVKEFKDLYHRHSSKKQTKQATHWFKVWINKLIVRISYIPEWARLSIWCVVVFYPVC